MTTLEPMRYMETQLQIIPFKILAKCMIENDLAKTEFSQLQYKLVLETCSYLQGIMNRKEIWLEITIH